MKANISRIRQDLETLRTFSDSCTEGVNRISWTPVYKKAVEYFKKEITDLGLIAKEDGMGILMGTLAGTDPSAPMLLSGSHLDTVPNGGAFDGTAGFVAALEAARMIIDSKKPLRHTYQILGFVEEEGAATGVSVLASQFMAGLAGEPQMNQIQANGKSLRQLLTDYGVSADIQQICRIQDPVKAFLEMHIEQGPVLERKKIPIGIVENIVGYRAFSIEITGEAGHAGSTPMNMRRDAGIAAFQLILSANQFVRNHYLEDAVFTVGQMTLKPGGINVIPQKAVFTADLRSQSEQILDGVTDYIREKAKELEETQKISVTIKTVSSTPPVPMHSHLQELLKQSAKELGYSFLSMNSGAGHDSEILAHIWDTAMLFVPSQGGISHNPAEHTSYEDIGKGTEVLYETLRKLDCE